MIQSQVGDARFYARRGPHPLAAVAKAALATAPDVELMLTGIGPLQSARSSEVTFLDNRRYASLLETSHAGAVIVHPEMVSRVPCGMVPILTKAPYEGWARVARLFHPLPPLKPLVHPMTAIDPTAKVDPSCEIGAFTAIEAGAEIGARCRIGANVTIGQGVVLGDDCRIGANATVSHAIIGARVYIYPGARIGQEGFSFAATTTGFLSVPQLGRVILGDDVEIGANCTIDRGSSQDTIIGEGTRLDNAVHVGHNVHIGRYCALAGQCGFAGSVVVEDFVQAGGQVGFAPHITIGKGAKIGGKGGVIADVPAGATMVGNPAQPRIEFFRQVAIVKHLAEQRHRDTHEKALREKPAPPSR